MRFKKDSNYCETSIFLEIPLYDKNYPFLCLNFCLSCANRALPDVPAN
jgi:hypothetical protein